MKTKGKGSNLIKRDSPIGRQISGGLEMVYRTRGFGKNNDPTAPANDLESFISSGIAVANKSAAEALAKLPFIQRRRVQGQLKRGESPQEVIDPARYDLDTYIDNYAAKRAEIEAKTNAEAASKVRFKLSQDAWKADLPYNV